MEPQKSIGIRKQARTIQASEVKEEVVASQDDTPQQHPTPGGSAEPEKHRAEQGAEESPRLSDASETIVSGEHAAGTKKVTADDGGAPGAAHTVGSADDNPAGRDAADDPAGSAGSTGSAGSAADQPADDGLDHDDWEAAFAEAAGTSEATVVPGGHPSLAQRSTLPMRRASTMPNVSRYQDLTDEERQQAGHIDAELPASAGGDKAPDSPNASADTGFGSAETGAAAGAAAAGATAAGVTAHAGSDASPKTTPVSTGAQHRSASEESTETAAATQTASLDETAPLERSSGTHSAAVGTAGAAAASGPEPDAARATGADSNSANTNSAAAAGFDTSGSGMSEVGPAARPDDDDISEEEIRRRAQERERAGAAKPVLARILQVMIAVFFPVMLLAAAIRVVATPLFLWAEYHRPGFPADSYGFSTDDRMTYGSYAVDYLLNFSGARYLGDLVTASGEPLYLESEVSHMADVKTVLTIAFVAALVMAVLSLFACIYLAKRSPGGIRRAMFSGSVVTLVLVGALTVTAVLGWESFFTQVHSVFFANGNWTFRMDDTLIRLFPAQFWMDAGIVIAGLVLLTCIAVLIAAWPTKARRERSRRKQEEARRRYLDSLEAV